MTISLKRIMELAEKATPGECTRNDNRDYAEVARANVMQAMVATEADAAFLQICSPETILALCKAVQAVQVVIGSLMDDEGDWLALDEARKALASFGDE